MIHKFIFHFWTDDAIIGTALSGYVNYPTFNSTYFLPYPVLQVTSYYCT
jgi:hypothetical protein